MPLFFFAAGLRIALSKAEREHGRDGVSLRD
jgi:hypothetical protein